MTIEAGFGVMELQDKKPRIAEGHQKPGGGKEGFFARCVRESLPLLAS